MPCVHGHVTPRFPGCGSPAARWGAGVIARKATEQRHGTRAGKAGQEPVFVHSGFRASSTWLWSKFRAHESLLCFYEPFNEQLCNLTPHTISEARSDAWRSHHPASAPYMLEYAGMLGQACGVPGFPATREPAMRYIGHAGPEGPLDEDVAAYVGGLVNHARACGRTPLLACTRTLGRAAGLKAAFGGYHILLIRNLFQQWNSYAGQARFGNWYFLHNLYETMNLAQVDPVVAQLAGRFPPDTLSSLEAWVAPGNFDRVFCYFIGFHLYFLTLARRAADLVIDVNRLARPGPAYRRAIVARIARDIGIRLDLRDASEQVDFPLHPVADRQGCTVAVEEAASSIKTACGADEHEAIFIDALVADTWRAQAIFQRNTAGVFEHLAVVEAGNEAVRGQLAQSEEAKRAAEARGDEHAAKLEQVCSELEAQRQRAAQAEAALAAARAHLSSGHDVPAGTDRLRALLGLLEAQREDWASLPAATWYRRLLESLEAMPGLERASAEPGGDASPDGVARAVWHALVGGP